MKRFVSYDDFELGTKHRGSRRNIEIKCPPVCPAIVAKFVDSFAGINPGFRTRRQVPQSGRAGVASRQSRDFFQSVYGGITGAIETVEAAEWLPQGPQALLGLDRIEIDGDCATAVVQIREEDCVDHLPNHPVIPGTKMLEMCLLVGTVLLLVHEKLPKKTFVTATGMQLRPNLSASREVRRPVAPGELIRIAVELSCDYRPEIPGNRAMLGKIFRHNQTFATFEATGNCSKLAFQDRPLFRNIGNGGGNGNTPH